MRNDIRKKEMLKYDKESFEYKNLDKKQYIYKILANAMYGIIGAPFFRYYSKDMAESITRSGHYLVKEASSWFNKNGLKTIYGDTDSVFFYGKEIDTKDLSKKLVDYFNEHLKNEFNIDKSYIVMDFKKKLNKFLITSKKKYVGLEENGELELTGFECIKRDTIKFAADSQLELFNKILKENYTLEDSKKWLENLKIKFFDKNLEVDNFILYKKITKAPEEFSAVIKGQKTPIHVKVFQDYNKYAQENNKEELEVGQYIPFIIINGDPLEGIHPDLYNGEFDRKYCWNKRIYPVLQRILEVVYKDFNWDENFIIDYKPKKKRKKKEEIIEEILEK